jgi:aspartyl-tRNA(Asn)/glutamyl-tRNA(Gln) amidotransferase subunit C
MAETITPDQVRKTAQLGRILLSDEEVKSFTSQLGDILTYIGKLNELDTETTEPLHHVLPLTNVLRQDEPRPSLGSDLAVREAPARRAGFFKVPKVLGGDEGGGA